MMDTLAASAPDDWSNVLVLKMDCDGCEGQALRGARYWLSRSPPCHIHLDVQPRVWTRFGTNVSAAWAELRTLGYRGVQLKSCVSHAGCSRLSGGPLVDAFMDRYAAGDSSAGCERHMWKRANSEAAHREMCRAGLVERCAKSCGDLLRYRLWLSLQAKPGGVESCETRVRVRAGLHPPQNSAKGFRARAGLNLSQNSAKGLRARAGLDLSQELVQNASKVVYLKVPLRCPPGYTLENERWVPTHVLINSSSDTYAQHTKVRCTNKDNSQGVYALWVCPSANFNESGIWKKASRLRKPPWCVFHD